MTKKGEKLLKKTKVVEGFCCFVQRVGKVVKVTLGTVFEKWLKVCLFFGCYFLAKASKSG